MYRCSRALHKSPGLRADASADDRAAWLLNGLCSTAATAVPSIYPRNFPVHRLPEVGLRRIRPAVECS